MTDTRRPDIFMLKGTLRILAKGICASKIFIKKADK